jgi:HNH endonuclease
MSELSDIRPSQQQRVIDLASAAGVDISDWGNYKGGKAKAAANPKYCYEWSFIEPKRVVVLNLWYKSMRERGATIVQDHNFRQDARKYALRPKQGVWARRALNMDRAVQTAVRDNLPVRVIVCDGAMRDRDDPKATASRVDYRLLDPVHWAVTAYDSNTGQCTVTRGALANRFVDQFSVPQALDQAPERRAVSGEAFVRDPEVRVRALLRANGKCEWCSQVGFRMPDGRLFLETHHIVPLAEGGPDSDANVVALCPNHHREAHHGALSQEMRSKLLLRLRAK